MSDDQLKDLKKFFSDRIATSETSVKEDLKEYIDARITQSETKLGERMDGVEGQLRTLRKEMADGFVGVGDALEVMEEHFDQRITRLEQIIVTP